MPNSTSMSFWRSTGRKLLHLPWAACASALIWAGPQNISSQHPAPAALVERDGCQQGPRRKANQKFAVWSSRLWKHGTILWLAVTWLWHQGTGSKGIYGCTDTGGQSSALCTSDRCLAEHRHHTLPIFGQKHASPHQQKCET